MLEHVNRKLGRNGLSKRTLHQEIMSQQEISDEEEEDMSTLELRLSPRGSLENLSS